MSKEMTREKAAKLTPTLTKPEAKSQKFYFPTVGDGKVVEAQSLNEAINKVKEIK